MDGMANNERPEERQARVLVEASLRISLNHTDDNGEVDYGFDTTDGRRAALEVTTVTSPQAKRARGRWVKESPRFPPSTLLSSCWDVWGEDIDLEYRGLIERLDPNLAVLDAAGKTFDRAQLHEFWGSPSGEQQAATALAQEHVDRAAPFPELCHALGPERAHQIQIVRAGGWSASGSVAALALIQEELNAKPDNFAKLRGAGEKHLFVWVDSDTDLAVARPFRGGTAAELWTTSGSRATAQYCLRLSISCGSSTVPL